MTRASQNLPTLPHKPGDMASPQPAFAAMGRFRLEVFTRFGPLRPGLEQKVERALEVWPLLGSLGLRANRGGGSLWPKEAPATGPDFKNRLAQLQCTWPVYLAGIEAGGSAVKLQAAATDTVSEPQWVFGSARGGRLASPLKLKVVHIDQQLRLLITAPDERTIAAAKQALLGKPVPALSHPATWSRISP